MDISVRIRRLRGELTREQFSKITGIPPQTLYKYERRTGKVSLESVEILSKSLNVRYEWLVFGRLPVHYAEEVSPITCQPAAFTNGPDNALWLPLVEAALPAGQSAFTPSAHGQHTYAFGQDFIASKGDPQHMVLMRVAGDSMAPEVLDNDIVLIDQSKRGIVPGKLFAVGFEEIVYLKRMDYVPGKLVLSCASPHCPPVELDVQDQNEARFRIIGRVLWVGRDLA